MHTQHIFNENIYISKWFTILENQFIGNLELFWTKPNSGFYTKYYEWYSAWGYHE